MIVWNIKKLLKMQIIWLLGVKSMRDVTSEKKNNYIS